MRSRRFRPRFSLALLLSLVVFCAVVLGLRQGLYVPIARQAEVRRTLEAAGLTVRTEAVPSSWRNVFFSTNDLLEVTSVEAVDGKLPAGMFTKLAFLPRLTTLTLTGCDVSDADILAIGKIRSLRELDLTNTRVGDAGIRQLVDLPLTELRLVGTRVTGDSLPAIGQITTLTYLDLPAADRAGGDGSAGVTDAASSTWAGERNRLIYQETIETVARARTVGHVTVPIRSAISRILGIFRNRSRGGRP